MEYDRRTIRAAMHLRIGDFEQSEDASNKSSISDSHTSLKPIAEGAGKYFSTFSLAVDLWYPILSTDLHNCRVYTLKVHSGSQDVVHMGLRLLYILR